jgi:hypothetical protein
MTRPRFNGPAPHGAGPVRYPDRERATCRCGARIVRYGADPWRHVGPTHATGCYVAAYRNGKARPSLPESQVAEPVRPDSCDQLVAEAERRRVPLSAPTAPQGRILIVPDQHRPVLVLITGGKA